MILKKRNEISYKKQVDEILLSKLGGIDQMLSSIFLLGLWHLDYKVMFWIMLSLYIINELTSAYKLVTTTRK